MIIGTAGHIDHGKTTLVRALTGVDTDRLPEEKRRGITIELGFAPLSLDGIGTVGIVDVPGHEAFVRTMVAGATGIDVAMLVIAADEGVMPQTREHVSILTLLGTRAGVVALTKCDLVDEEWLTLVTADVDGFLQGTALDGAPIIRTPIRSDCALTLNAAAVHPGSNRSLCSPETTRTTADPEYRGVIRSSIRQWLRNVRRTSGTGSRSPFTKRRPSCPPSRART